jgi:hypothetical protein
VPDQSNRAEVSGLDHWQAAADKVMADVADMPSHFGGFLRCETCRVTMAVDPAYFTQGWPTCHGYTMTWWTQRQIDAGEIPL